MVVSRTIFTWLKFILPEQKQGFQLEVTLIAIHSFLCPTVSWLVLCPGRIFQGNQQESSPVLGAGTPDHFSTSTGDQGLLQAGRKREHKVWDEPQEAA